MKPLNKDLKPPIKALVDNRLPPTDLNLEKLCLNAPLVTFAEVVAATAAAFAATAPALPAAPAAAVDAAPAADAPVPINPLSNGKFPIVTNNARKLLNPPISAVIGPMRVPTR